MFKQENSLNTEERPANNISKSTKGGRLYFENEAYFNQRIVREKMIALKDSQIYIDIKNKNLKENQ